MRRAKPVISSIFLVVACASVAGVEYDLVMRSEILSSLFASVFGLFVVLLVALGLWTDGSGKREILDWQMADSESKAAWEPFVHRLWERGLRPEVRLQAVIRDGCGELGEAIA